MSFIYARAGLIPSQVKVLLTVPNGLVGSFSWGSPDEETSDVVLQAYNMVEVLSSGRATHSVLRAAYAQTDDNAIIVGMATSFPLWRLRCGGDPNKRNERRKTPVTSGRIESANRLRVPRPISLREHVQETVRTSILNGEFRLGEHLIERELCAAMQVSRPLLREALAHLEARGLIERVPSRGFVVATPTIERVQALYEVRGAIEALAAQFFAARASAEDVALLRSRFDVLKSLTDRPDLGHVRAATSEFYDVLMDRCGNSEIRTVLEPVLDRVAFMRTQSMTRPGRFDKSVAEIGRIVEAISQGDSDTARQLSEEHIVAAAASALESLQETAGAG